MGDPRTEIMAVSFAMSVIDEDTMANNYGFDSNQARDGITAALMGIQRPPGGMSSPGVPGLPPGIGGEMSPFGGPPAGSTPPMGSTPGLGGVPPLSGGMASPGAPMQPGGLTLPGTMQPGQLPLGMNPQNAMGVPPQPMPPR
jgi:hypothetical protein